VDSYIGKKKVIASFYVLGDASRRAMVAENVAVNPRLFIKFYLNKESHWRSLAVFCKDGSFVSADRLMRY